MQILYFLFRGLAWLVSKLPPFLLYGLSGLLYFLLRHVFGYRRKVIYDNLKKSFPEFSEKEINQIIKTYYRHISDIIIEVIHTPGLSANELKSRYTFKNPEVLEQLVKKNLSITMLTGHLGNWEWMGPGLILNFPKLSFFAVVKPLSDKFFEDYMTHLRQLHKSDCLFPFKQTLRYMIRNKDLLTITLFAADQTPHRSEINFTAPFLNRETPFFTGFERIAKMLNQAVVFVDVYRISRGHYEAEFHLISDKSSETLELEITHTYIRLLEQAIRRRPYNWLWSHRRWKYAPKAKD
jgi:Kdo2-lipid IVA lauroyltransferase/acyltransferase